MRVIDTKSDEPALLRLQNVLLKQACARKAAALERLADAADAVGVRFFDTDTMAPEVEAMQSATRSARAETGEPLLASSPPDIATVAEQCAEIAERHGYDDAAFAIRSAFSAKGS